jgi:hypothetical protein
MGWDRDPETELYWRPNGEPSKRLLAAALNVYCAPRGRVRVREAADVFRVTEQLVLDAVETERFMFVEDGAIEMDGV